MEINTNFREVTGKDSMVITDKYIQFYNENTDEDKTFQLLPPSQTRGLNFIFKYKSMNEFQVTLNGNIDGEGSKVMNTVQECYNLYSDGEMYRTISYYAGAN